MTERVCQFGPDERLVGVLTEPAPELLRPGAPAILWLNAGVLHHVGPFGWYATLARRLSDRGFLNFRFDLSGIGDSPGRDDNHSTLDRACDDVAVALDYLGQRRQVKRFVLAGLCSGAVLAHHVAVRDERVAGAIFFDGCGYRTTGYYLRHYAARALRWRSWLNAAGRGVRVVSGRGGKRQEQISLLSESFFFDFPAQEQARIDLANLARRGTRLLFLYTGGVAEQYFNHRRQFGEMFGPVDPKGEMFDVEYAAEADHLYAAHYHRQAMFARVESWVNRIL